MREDEVVVFEGDVPRFVVDGLAGEEEVEAERLDVVSAGADPIAVAVPNCLFVPFGRVVVEVAGPWPAEDGEPAVGMGFGYNVVVSQDQFPYRQTKLSRQPEEGTCLVSGSTVGDSSRSPAGGKQEGRCILLARRTRLLVCVVDMQEVGVGEFPGRWETKHLSPPHGLQGRQ